MSDVLKQTLFWAANPTHTVVDDNGSGTTLLRSITAAESHDASDATFAQLHDADDGGAPVSASGHVDIYAAVGTASVSGAISFVRLKHRGKHALTSGPGPIQGAWRPRINGTLRGGSAGLGSSFANDSQDFTTDPADSAAWTNAKINAQTFGIQLSEISADPGQNSEVDVYTSEFSVELWGPDVQVMTAASVALDAIPNAGLVTPGPMAVTAVSVPLTMTPNAGTVVPGLRVLQPDSVAMALEVQDGEFGQSALRDPQAVVAQRTSLDSESALVTVRSFKPSLLDQSVTTFERFTSPGVWANGATRLEPLYGASSQGVQGSSGAGNGIQGTGLIAGIKLFAIVRAMKSAAGSSLTNVRFGTAMGLKALLAQPTIYDFALTPTDAMFEVVQSNLIATGPFGNPFTWGNGTDSVWAALVGWTLNHTYSNASSGQFTQVDVAEAWVEIHGALGTAPETIELVHAIGSLLKTVPLRQDV